VIKATLDAAKAAFAQLKAWCTDTGPDAGWFSCRDFRAGACACTAK
jgi:hypothetical protein